MLTGRPIAAAPTASTDAAVSLSSVPENSTSDSGFSCSVISVSPCHQSSLRGEGRAEAQVPPAEGHQAGARQKENSGGPSPPECAVLMSCHAATFCTTLIDSCLRPAVTNSKTRAPRTTSAAIRGPLPAPVAETPIVHQPYAFRSIERRVSPLNRVATCPCRVVLVGSA